MWIFVADGSVLLRSLTGNEDLALSVSPSKSSWVSSWGSPRKALRFFFFIFRYVPNVNQIPWEAPDSETFTHRWETMRRSGGQFEPPHHLCGSDGTVMHATATGPAATLATVPPSNLRPEHFLEVIILFDVRCLLFPPISILSKGHRTTVMGFATLQLQKEHRTLNTLRMCHKKFQTVSLIRFNRKRNQNKTSCNCARSNYADSLSHMRW